MPSRRAFIRSSLACAAGLALCPSIPACAAPGLRVMASTFPVWLLARPIAAAVPGIELDLLLEAMAGCPHDYALTPRDMMRLARADVLACVGGGFEPFLGGVLSGFTHITVLDAGRDIPALVAADERARGKHEGHGHEEDPEHDVEGNPHYFASPARAAAMARAIAAGLAGRLPGEADAIMAAGEAEAAALEALGAKVAALGAKAGNTSFVLQHDALAWFFHDADLCVTRVLQEEEESWSSCADLVGVVGTIITDSTRRYVLVAEPQFPMGTIDTLARETGAEVIRMDSLASGPADAPMDHYLSVMEANVAAVEACLAAARGGGGRAVRAAPPASVTVPAPARRPSPGCRCASSRR